MSATNPNLLRRENRSVRLDSVVCRVRGLCRYYGDRRSRRPVALRGRGRIEIQFVMRFFTRVSFRKQRDGRDLFGHAAIRPPKQYCYVK